MKQFLEEAINNGAVITKKYSDNPKLILIGEDHMGRNVISPKDLFYRLSPKLFFCEGIQEGLEITFDKVKALKINRFKEYPEDTFETLIQGAKYDLGWGYCGEAITDWYDKCQNTKFIGLDLKGRTKQHNILMDDVESFLELLSEHVDNELNLPADEITDAR